MLINKGYSSGDVLCFKVVNGDEIVAKIVEETETGFLVSRPCTVIPSQQGIGLIQAMFSVDPEIDIQVAKSHVMIAAPTFDKLQSHYIQVTTGIQTVSKGSIIA